ncbi:hypothetical protein KKB18_10015 [bacterium]|nr:hypothetical protein [bacterium]
MVLKDKISEFIKQRRFSEITELEKKKSRLFRPLFGLLYNEDHDLRLGAAYTLGIVSQKIYSKKTEKVTQLLQKLLWSLNDESGFVCWGAPEAIGEIVRNIPELKAIYAQFLISFLSHPQVVLNNDYLEKGTLIALARIGIIDKEQKVQLAPILENYLDSRKGEIKELTIWCGFETGIDSVKNKVREFLGDNMIITTYIDGVKVSKPISDFIN